MIRFNPIPEIPVNGGLFPDSGEFRQKISATGRTRGWKMIYSTLMCARSGEDSWRLRRAAWAAARIFVTASLRDSGKEKHDILDAIVASGSPDLLPGWEVVSPVLSEVEKVAVWSVFRILCGEAFGPETPNPYASDEEEEAIVTVWSCLHDGITLVENAKRKFQDQVAVVLPASTFISPHVANMARKVGDAATGEEFLVAASDSVFKDWGCEETVPSCMAGDPDGCGDLDGEALRNERLRLSRPSGEPERNGVFDLSDLDEFLSRDQSVLADADLFGGPRIRGMIFREWPVDGQAFGALRRKFDDPSMALISCWNRKRFTQFTETGDMGGFWESPVSERDCRFHDAPGDLRAQLDRLAFGGKANRVTFAIGSFREDHPELTSANISGLLGAFGHGSPVIIRWEQSLAWQSTFCFGNYQQSPAVFKYTPWAVARACEIRFIISSIMGSGAVGQKIMDELVRNNGIWGSLLAAFALGTRNPYIEFQIHGILTPSDINGADLIMDGSPVDVMDMARSGMMKVRPPSREYLERPVLDRGSQEGGNRTPGGIIIGG